MLKTFSIGGVHPHENKLSAHQPIITAEVPAKAVILLGQHIGAPAKPVVAKGDVVKVGTKIAEPAGFVSAAIHSSVSGKVAKIDTIVDASGYAKPAIFIDVEGDEWEETIDRSATLVKECELSAEEIVKKIADAGIVGLGGACFPTQVKLCPPPSFKAECVIINAVECEPYITADYRSVMDDAKDLVTGAKIMKKMAEAKTVYICIKESHPDLIEKVKSVLTDAAGVEVRPVPDVYPMGWERVLVREVLHKEYGGLPAEAGAIIGNASSAIAIAKAFEKGEAITQKNLTVSGECVKDPHNVCVPVGMPVSEIIEDCGGYTQDTVRLISGGPMMGKALISPEVPVGKGSSGVLLLTKEESVRKPMHDCIRCAKCVQVCPMGLNPAFLMRSTVFKNWEMAEADHIQDCIECGSCSFTCPANRPLLDQIRVGKSKVMGIIRSRKS